MTTRAPMSVRSLLWAACWLSTWSLGCQRREEVGQPPPEPPSPGATANVCGRALQQFSHTDLRGLLPPAPDNYCVDPNSPPRAYGLEGEGSMDEVCTELFDGECELYRGFGLVRVTTLRYISADGSPAMVSVNVSRFGGSEGALAFFSRRVLGDQDPKRVSVRPLDGLRFAALGTGVAYVQSGPLVVELVYVNEDEPPSKIRETSARLLPQFLTEVVAREGKEPLPLPLTRLPAEHRLRFGTVVEPRDGFGVKGLGLVATGYYEDGAKRYRVSVSESHDEAGAKDCYAAVRRLPGRHTLKDAAYDAFELRQTQPDGPTVSVLVGKLGKRVVAIADEPFALATASPDEVQRVSLDRTAKFEMLKQVLQSRSD